MDGKRKEREIARHERQTKAKEDEGGDAHD